VVELFKKISTVRTNQYIGILVFVINRAFVEETFQNVYFGENSTLSILDESNTVIFSNNEELLGQNLVNNLLQRSDSEQTGYFTDNDKLISYGTCQNGWKVYASIPVVSLMEEIYSVGQNTLYIGLLCMVVSILLALIISSSISIPLAEIMGLMKKVEEGDLTVTSNLKGKDELAALSTSFNVMIGKIKELLLRTHNTSKQVEKNAQDVNRFAEQTTSSVQQVSSTIEYIAEGANKQAREAQESVDVMEQLAQRIENISINIKSMNEATELVRETSTRAAELVDNLNQKTRTTAQVTEKIKQDIEKLYDKTGEIKKVIQVIENISEQTNLLSLNASIEAARAGQAGQGFSVVAQEIRNMSEQSVEATSMVREIVKAIDDETRNTVEEVDRAQPLYKEQQQSVEETALAFEEIIKVIKNIFSDINRANEAIQEINNFKSKVLADIENMASIAQESAATTEEVSAESEEQASIVEQFVSLANELKDAVKRLNEAIESFKI